MFQIDLDVNRTYRDHDMFRDRYNSRQNALFHVLAAYSVYNTEVGYCQVRQKNQKILKIAKIILLTIVVQTLRRHLTIT